MHLLPFILILIPFLLFFDISLKNASSPPKTSETQNLKELEQNLRQLINKNSTDLKIQKLSQSIKQNTQKRNLNYQNTPKRALKGYHFFQHIFSLIKNNTKDEKIIKILHSYFPSSANAQLYAMLKSFKTFLNLLKTTPQASILETSLNQNNITPTLFFLEERLNKLLTTLKTENNLNSKEKLTKLATIYSLVFACFLNFYSKELTNQILKLAETLSPELYFNWHLPLKKHYLTPKYDTKQNTTDTTLHINKQTV